MSPRRQSECVCHGRSSGRGRLGRFHRLRRGGHCRRRHFGTRPQRLRWRDRARRRERGARCRRWRIRRNGEPFECRRRNRCVDGRRGAPDEEEE